MGNWRLEHLFTLRQSRELYRTYQQRIVECDLEIEKLLPSGSFIDLQRYFRKFSGSSYLARRLVYTTTRVGLVERWESFEQLPQIAQALRHVFQLAAKAWSTGSSGVI
jgi:hypothetical protein